MGTRAADFNSAARQHFLRDTTDAGRGDDSRRPASNA